MGSPLSNAYRLRKLMADHGLSVARVGHLLGRSPQTVREWRCDNHNNISDYQLELLELKLAAARAPAPAVNFSQEHIQGVS